MIHFLHTYIPHPIMFKIGALEIRWYGFLIACGALLAFLVIYYLAREYKLKKDDIYNLVFYVVIFGLIGDRLYYVIYAWNYYSQHLSDIFKIWQGGLAIHGAIIAGILVVLIYAKKHKLSPWLILDILVVGLALAMSIGRWGNYFNQELFGLPTKLAWGIIIAKEQRPVEFLNSVYFHPTFLYESLWDLFTFLVLFCWHRYRLAKNIIPEKIRGLGNIALTYLILYSCGRFLNEFLRIDYSPYVFGIRWAQIASLTIILVCLGIIGFKVINNLRKKSKIKANPKDKVKKI